MAGRLEPLLRRPRLALAGIAVLLQLPTLVVRRPLILPDEAGFLLTSYQLGADGPPSGLFYYPGYSLLLAPVAALSTELETVMWGVHALNTVLAVASILLAHALARRLLPDRGPAVAFAIAVTAQLYPAFRMFSAFALSENLFVPVSLALAVLAIDLDDPARRRRAAVALAILGGASLAIHARSVSITAAAVIALIAARRRRGPGLTPAFAAYGVTLVVAFALVRLTLSNGGVEIPGNDAEASLAATIDKNLSPSAAPDWVLGGLGQAFYLAAASVGSSVVGLAAFVPSIRRRLGLRSDAVAAAGWLIVPMFVFSFGVSVLFMAGSGGDPAIYGRYNEGVLAPVLVLGLAALVSSPWAGSIVRWTAWAMPVAALILVVGRGPEFFEGRRQMINLTAIHPITDQLGTIRIAVVAAFATAALLLLRAALGRSASAALLVLGVVWSAGTLYDLNSAREALDVLDDQDQLLEALDRAEAAGVDTTCVTLDLTGVGDRWHQSNYRLRRTDIDFRYWLSDGDAEPPCPDLVITRRSDLGASRPAASLLAVEPWSRMGLWVLAGEGRSAALHGRSPIETPYATIPAEQNVELEILDAPAQLPVGEETMVRVRITNLGPAALVPHLGLDGVGGINVGLEWRDPTRPENRLVEPVRVALPAIVWPGDTVEVEGTIRAADAPIAEGPWLLVSGVVQEGVAWLPTETSVEVTVGG